MYREVTGYIKENHMIEKGDTVLAGVSGGGDSVTMLYILKEYQKETGVYPPCGSRSPRNPW